ncbi:MAG: proteasome lid subunit RPN8/RPN11 [Candidatus Latescibacterota bacterium]|jgi:proteasome lid subunit RPN8/RPN11
MFDDRVWNEMFAHAKEDYSAECCGMITADANGKLTVHRCENIQDKLHAADPETHPRTSQLAYRMNDLQVMRIQQAAENEGGRMVAIYHSHIDVDAYFSQEDQNAAMFDGEPLFPGIVYPVIPVKDGEVDREGRKVFQWHDETSTFEQVT